MDSDCRLEAKATFSLQISIIHAAMELLQSMRVALEMLRCLTPARRAVISGESPKRKSEDPSTAGLLVAYALEPIRRGCLYSAI